MSLGEGVGESAADSNPEVKRRSSRIVQAVPMTVSGVDALGRPFQERTSTLIINCHGCRYQSKHYVLKNMWITLDVPNPEQGFQPRTSRARVMWIQRPRTVRELFQVGVELETPGNIWGIAFPPPDWFPFPESREIGALGAEESPQQPGDWTTSEPARIVVEDNLRTMPSSGTIEPIAPHQAGAELASTRVAMAEQALARQMANLLAEAKQQLQDAIRESTAQAISEESRPLLAELQKQVQEAAERSVEAATSEAIRSAVEQAAQTSQARLQTLHEQWSRDLDQSLEQAGSRTAQRLDDIVWQRNAAFDQQLEARLQNAIQNAEQAAQSGEARLQSLREQWNQNLEQHVEQAGDRIAQRLDELVGQRNAAFDQQVEARLQNAVQSAEQSALASQARLQSLQEQWNRDLEQSVGQADSRAAQRLDDLAAQRSAAFDQLVEARLQSAMQNAEQAAERFNVSLAGAQENVERFEKRAGDSAETILRQVEQRIQNTTEQARHQLTNLEEATRQLDERVSGANAAAQAAQASESRLQGLHEQWNRDLEDSVQQAGTRAAQRLDDLVSQRNATFEEQVEARLQNAMQNAEQAADTLERLEKHAGDSAEAILQQVEQRIQTTTEQARRQLGDLDEATRQLDERIAGASAAAQANWQSRLDADAAAARDRWNQQIESSLESAAQQAAERLRGNFQQTSAQFDQDMQLRAAAMSAALAESRAATDSSLETLRTYLAAETAQAQGTVEQIRSVSQSLEDWSSRAAEITRSAQVELERRAAAVVEAESRQLASSAEEGIAAWTGRLEPALEMAGRQAIERLGSELERQLDAGLDRASRALEALQGGTLDAEGLLRAHQETLAKVSQQEVENVANRLRESLGRLERDFSEAGRAATAKWLAELELKGAETTHATFESMYKTAEWYEKKVQNQMQATMDKGLELAAGRLREKAGEISGLFATELDHYTRGYMEHAQGHLEESRRETLEAVGKQTAELASSATESFAQQTRSQTEAAMTELRDQSASAVEQLNAQMQARAEQVRKASDAGLFQAAREFQAAVSQEKEQTLDAARQDLAKQTAFARETLRLAEETLEERLRQTVLSLSEESMEEYKKRLENASNSWLLATVTRLNQQSDRYIESIAQSTEARLRGTCNDVFAGLGETLRLRMLDLFGPPPASSTPANSSSGSGSEELK